MSRPVLADAITALAAKPAGVVMRRGAAVDATTVQVAGGALVQVAAWTTAPAAGQAVLLLSAREGSLVGIPLGADAPDVWTKTESDARYVNLPGDTMTGQLAVTAAAPQLVLHAPAGNAAVRMTLPGFGARLEMRGGGGWWFVDDNGNLMPVHASAFATTLSSPLPLPSDSDGHTDLAAVVGVLLRAVAALPGGMAALTAALHEEEER